MPLKSDLSEEAIWGPQNILITLAILLCYYHNYPFAPNVLIRNSPLAPRGVKRTLVGGMLKLGKGILQLLPYALWSGKYKRKGGRSQCFWKMKLSHSTSSVFLWHLCHSKYGYTPFSFLYLHIFLTHLRPSSRCSIFSILLTISCCLLLSHFHLTPLFTVTSHPCLFLLSLPASTSFAFSLPPHLQKQRAFSISAPLLQINDLICRNKQVSSTSALFTSPLQLLILQQHASERVEGKKREECWQICNDKYI